MKIKKLIARLNLNQICILSLSAVFFSCQDDLELKVDENSLDLENQKEIIETSAKNGWNTFFFDDFNNLSNWNKTERKDYNSDICNYKPAQAFTTNVGNNTNALVLIAKKKGNNNYESGHVKSKRKFRPKVGEQMRFTSKIVLKAKNWNNQFVDFHNSYGAWPAFWTVEENGWPTKGEIDIMEGYSYGNDNLDRYASNLFYGRNVGVSELNHSQTTKIYTNKIKKIWNDGGWNVYEMIWKNWGQYQEIHIQVNGNWIGFYRNSSINNLKLENFQPHNAIFNLNVGSNPQFNIFDNSKINLLKQTEMLVDWFKVETKSL